MNQTQLPVADRFLRNASQISLCLNKVELIEDSIQTNVSCFGMDGQVCVVTGEHTGRAANDKYIVDRKDMHFVEFGEAGKPMSPDTFLRLKDLISGYTNGRNVYVNDVVAGHAKVRVITDRPSHALFATHMFRSVDEPHKEVDLTIIAMPGCVADDSYGLNSTTFVAVDLIVGLALIGGTAYAGEIKKTVFTYLSYVLPQKSILPMHASVTTDIDGKNSAIFFGLSGTGKTTLSADPNRMLVGDDEHGWDDDGLYNFEAGCYAKVIRLSKQNEPMIWGACHEYGTLLENVSMTEQRVIDFNNSEITENTRAAYSLDKIKNAHVPGFKAEHPNNIIMLTCDAYGVLPSVARLSPEAAAYHFLSGYTAKVAGTEAGVTEPVATFSPCFGGPFMPMAPSTYANLLKRKIEKHKPDVWLVNTGWVGGGPDKGKRIDIKTTRKIINMILSGEMRKMQFVRNERFNMDVPKDIEHTEPVKSYDNKNKYDVVATELVEKFNNNINRFTLSEEILNAGMPSD